MNDWEAQNVISLVLTLTRKDELGKKGGGG